MKRAFFSFVLCCLLFACSGGLAYADTGGTQRIETTVPCTVTLDVGEHGSVIVDGTRYTGGGSFRRDVGAVVTYSIEPDNGYEIAEMTYGAANVTAESKGGTYRAKPLEGDVTVAVTFSKAASADGPSSSLRAGDSALSRGATSVLAQTGDSTLLGVLLMLLPPSGAMLLVLGVISNRKES